MPDWAFLKVLGGKSSPNDWCLISYFESILSKQKLLLQLLEIFDVLFIPTLLHIYIS